MNTLEIVMVWKTSKGLFLTLGEALKKKNLHYDARDAVWEEPKKIPVLKSDKYGEQYFMLSPVQVT